jgi:hypothetical protein
MSGSFQLKTGAAYNRRTAKRSPVEVLHSIMEGDRTASKEKLYPKWRKEIEADDDLLAAVLHYAFVNFHSACEKELRTSRSASSLQSAPLQTIAVTARREKVKLLAKQFKAHVLLDSMMLNGKPMKRCTFAEMSTFGDVFKMIAAQGKPSETVGDVLSEADVRKLLKGAA